MSNRIYIIIIFLFCVWISLTADDAKPLPLETIIQNMELAIDPENNKQGIKTLITQMELTVPNQEIKLKITTTDKFPDKTKTVKEIPGIGTVTRILNGAQAWETSSQGEFREIKGKELELMKFELFMKTPNVPMQKAFKDIKIVERDVLVDDDMCYKLSCKPAIDLDIPPIVMYVNKDNFLTKKLEMTAETPAGPVSVSIIMEKYKEINGRKVPCKTKIHQLGAVLTQTLISVEENIEIKDIEFENPSPVEVFQLGK